LSTAWLTAAPQKFKSDDPIWVDPDNLPIPQPEEQDDRSQILDLIENTFTHKPDDIIPRAENINTLGEVPDSSWFTNRMGRRILNVEELVRGPDRGNGPDVSQPWTIISAKTEGITPGFRIRDARGDVYHIKFDPADNDQLATSSEVICTKLFHAFGYYVPENYLAFVTREMIRIDEKAEKPAKITDENGKERRLTERDVDRIFERIAVRADGRVQCVASLNIEGGLIGPFKYYGLRSDDPNDIFPHEHRRELRGLRVFSAWLNHDDSRSMNTKDFFIPEPGTGPTSKSENSAREVEPKEPKEPKMGFIRHYLIDFGSCLGSGSVQIQGRRAGNEYRLEWTPMLKSALTFGLWDRPWRYIDYPDYPSIGRFESDYFHPARWKPEYPNPAFERMTGEDAFWATRILMRFTDDMLAAVVRTGQWLDSEAEQYLLKTLIRRRDKIVKYYLGQVNPLDDFRIDEDRGKPAVTFTNLGEKAAIAPAYSYEWQWFRFDNRTGTTESLGPVTVTTAAPVPLPDDRGDYLLLKIRTITSGQAGWRKDVLVYVRNESQKKVVGVERE